ncbi:MAG: Lrp/AsnC family transcriptional regulator [Thermoplasmata archaeon]
MLDVDEIDMRIIKMLQGDGRLSFAETGRRLKLSESTIRKRVQSLQKRGVIKRFTVEVDPAKVGKNIVAIVGIDVEPTHLLTAAQELSEIREIRSVATSTGDHMIMMEIWTRDGRELTRLFSEKIGKIDGIKRICPSIILEKVKE